MSLKVWLCPTSSSSSSSSAATAPPAFVVVTTTPSVTSSSSSSSSTTPNSPPSSSPSSVAVACSLAEGDQEQPPPPPPPPTAAGLASSSSSHSSCSPLAFLPPAGAAASLPGAVVSTAVAAATSSSSGEERGEDEEEKGAAGEEDRLAKRQKMEGRRSTSRLMAQHQLSTTISSGWAAVATAAAVAAGGHMPWPVTTAAAMAGCTTAKRTLGGSSSVLLTTLLLVVVSAAFVPTPATATAQGFSGSQRAEDIPDFYDDYLSEDGNAYLSAEVGRLLKEHAENRDFVNSLDAQYYQITYPVQLQRQGKSQGISTRDASQIASNHVHRTSYRIKAFSHVFTVDLELNTELLSQNLMAHHRSGDRNSQVDHQIEHCYYHGTVKDYSIAVAAFRTCNGLAGIIQLGNETLIVSPMAGGEKLPKHPHFVIESKNSHIRQKCGYQTGYEWGMWERTFNRLGHGRKKKQTRHRYARDIRGTTKYIETALFLDKKFMEERNYSRVRALNDALQIANIADLYFKNINTRISITYLETWAGRNMIDLGRNQPISTSLINFYVYVGDNLHEFHKDTAHLITGEQFQSGESGMGVPNSICTSKSAGISVDLNVYEPHLVASTMTHMIGHNLYMKHDDGRGPTCYCQDWHGCIMSKTIVGQDNVQPTKFSKCSVDDYHHSLQTVEEAACLLHRPSKFKVPRPNPPRKGPTDSMRPGQSFECGNGRVDEGEQCDCGPRDKCSQIDPCCDPITCRLKLEAECATGPCCDNCRLRPKGYMCRKAKTECDIPEYCDGLHGSCPLDIYKKTGNKCGNGKGYCFKGVCPTLNNQCEVIWGYGGQASDETCYKQFNVDGVIYGNCGRHRNGSYIKCELGNIMCGTLQCQLGMQHPVTPNMDQSYSRTIVAMGGQEYECKTVRYELQEETRRGRDWTLVQDGTACGEKLICVNQTCESLYPFIESGQCKTNNNALECSGHGVCSNINSCFCNPGWTGVDCSIYDNSTLYTTPYFSNYPTTPTPPGGKSQSNSSSNKPYETGTGGRNTQYVGKQGSDTVYLVVGLVSVMGGVFFAFAFMALCYRSVVVHKNFSLCLRRKSTLPKYDAPYLKRPVVKKPPQQHLQPMMTKTEETSLDLGSRITFGNMPSYSPGRPPLSPTLSRSRSLDSCREQKMQMMRRSGPPAGGSQSEEEALQSGEEEAVSFIELPPNNLSKIPEKGILKKSYGLLTPAEKEKWGEESQSDNNDALSQSDNNADPECQVTEVERTLKSLHGYHEDIIDALKRASSHRSGATSMSSDELHAGHHDTYPRYPPGATGVGGPADFTRVKASHEKLADSGGEDDQVPPCGPIRIRNLEDLIRQLEHHPSRHMSPSGSEEIRMSETEADRHYRLDSSSCTESQGYVRPWRRGQDFGHGDLGGPLAGPSGSPGTPGDKLAELLQLASPEDHERILRAAAMLSPESPTRGRADNGGMGFVYGRYRQPPTSGSGTGSASGRSSDRLGGGGHEFSDGADSHAFTEEDDLERPDPGETADSESDEYSARPPSALLRSASEEVLPVTRYEAARFEAASPRDPRLYSPPSDAPSYHDDQDFPPPEPQNDDDQQEPAADPNHSLLLQGRYPEYKH
ncbi:disintegrin and metalloproteinase domain-containing protein unc-71-like isoform X6 [Macrobrachium nipponense]|uniref:disintegrin and metalloproteinase domain-containing protein unc-71-like isoform X6 n=1 Tax=Macrobrachium nipponense TaxID=159736 RepID=UPI0030C7E11B